MSDGRSCSPSFAFLVFGCRLNQAEAAEWQSILAARGGRIVPKEAADILCVHSCAVTEPAAHEVAKTVRAFRGKHPSTRVVLSGCAAELLPKDLAELIIPHDQKTNWIDRVLAFAGPLTEAKTASPEEDTKMRFAARPKTRASLIVQDGCDRFCAYCIVPHLRGTPISEPMNRLLCRAATLFAEGYREIVLTGCHLALYRDPETGADFIELLRRLRDVPGEGRFRIGSLEPCVLDDIALIRLIAEGGGRICPFLHFPIQSAADAVLSRMGRQYIQRDLRRLLDTVGAELPLCGLGADWIVGLPGETEAEAETTRMFLEDYPFTGAHVFSYSRRPGTPAALFPEQVPQHQIKARAEALQSVAEQVRERVLPKFLGETLTVIPERQRSGVWEGWSAQRIRCRLSGAAVRGEPIHFIPTTLLPGGLLA